MVACVYTCVCTCVHTGALSEERRAKAVHLQDLAVVGEAVLDPKGISDLTSEGRDWMMESMQGHPAGPTVAIREGFLSEKDLSWTRK